jgi:CBS domain-containing protein
MKIERMMTRDVRTCSPGDTLNRAAQIMWESDCGFLPVVDGDQVLGVVTDRDLCMGAYTQGVPLWAAPVSSVMSRQLWTCLPGDDVRDVESLMQDRKIRRVPVVGDSGGLVGVATLGDLARRSQSSAFQKATGGLAITKTLATICEPRPPAEAQAAAE